MRREREPPDEASTETDVFRNAVTRQPWHDEHGQREKNRSRALNRLEIWWRRVCNTRHACAPAAPMAGLPAACIASQLGNSVTMPQEPYARRTQGSDNGANASDAH
jgi:hypothetical protein